MPVAGPPSDDPVDRLVIQLRAYLGASAPRSQKSERRWTSGISVIFDTETTTDPSQRLRFGAYQVRDNGQLVEAGLFYAEDLGETDLAVLRQEVLGSEAADAAETLHLRSRADFVEKVLFKWGHDVGGLIIGFNLPFDISRIATGHTYGKGSMKGGFSFELAEGRPNLRVKHLSQRAAFINFAGKHSSDRNPDRGFFVDVKTLAAALTSQSHSLESLSTLLNTIQKSPLDDYDGPLTPEMVAYCGTDVQATWECFAKLAERYEAYGLNQTGLHDLYSEASLGKAYLQAMNVVPWRQAQPDFPPEMIGRIMSTYYGGRAEVHIRREITPVIHCDFLSMYPTVCTLMGLWRYVIAAGITTRDATAEIRELVASCERDELRDPAAWRELDCIVQVSPDEDIFPVRAQYQPDQPATIGLNCVTSAAPMWFTLADVLASKLLSGKTPQIVSAVRFQPKAPQAGLTSIMLEGVQIEPAKDDFYRLLIDQRRRIQAAEDAAPEAEKPALKAGQQSLKILANSTSYGIFVEVNVKPLDRPKVVVCYDFTGVGRKMTAGKTEEPGRYYHPLLGALITGAARLMLALAERNAIDQGLDWAFCDTDSLAIANTSGLPTAEFVRRVEVVREWFSALNPYEVKGSILQLEKVNFPAGEHNDLAKCRPVNCLAISAKRYVLFDRGDKGSPDIRKATAHGLGHMLPPYPDLDRKRIGQVGVHLWQEDLWCSIIHAHDEGRPDQVDLGEREEWDLPAASRYAATNQTLLGWFKHYNATRLALERVRPFNFLLAFQAKSRMQMAAVEPEALAEISWLRRSPNPASRYSRDLIGDAPEVFDRASGATVPWSWLKTYRRALARHHLHSELKFHGGDDSERGNLRRRHVQVWAVISIGKEADNLDERETLGDDTDDALQWELSRADRAATLTKVEEVLTDYRISDATLTERARVSHHTLAALRKGARVTQQSLLRIVRGAEELRQEFEPLMQERERWHRFALQIRDATGGRNRLATLLRVNASYLGRVLRKEKPMTPQMVERLSVLHSRDVELDLIQKPQASDALQEQEL
jgi:hypothetical protein